MKTCTIAAIALLVTAGSAAGQTQRSERPVRERAALRHQVVELEARYRQMIAELSRREGDRDYVQQLRDLEAMLERTRSQLQGEHAEDVERAFRAVEAAEQAAMAQHDLARSLSRSRAAAELEHREMAEVAERLRARESIEVMDADAELNRLFRGGPRSSWAPQDPADSIWRMARDRMNRRDYDDAAGMFARIHSEERYRQSAYRADALYWNAFALNRIGSRDAVRQSLELLERLIREYPEEDRHADTNGLLTTVQVRLAEMGNVSAREQVRATAVDEVRVTRAASLAEAEVRRAAEIAGITSTTPVPLETIVTALPGQRGNVLVQNGVIVGSSADVATVVNWGLPPGRLNSLSPQCARGDAEIQLIALNSLVRMDTAAAMPVLREVMTRQDECSAPLRQSAMTIIARVRNPEADRILAETARTDPDNGVRRTALVYLSSRNEDQAVGIAETTLRTAESAPEREWALQALARMRTDRAWAVVRDHADRTDLPAETRRSAIAILSGSNDSTNTAFLRGLYSRVGSDRQLKEAILMSSAFRRGAADPEWMLGIARDASEEARIREYAVMVLSRNEAVGTPSFIALYDGSEDKRVKLAVLRVLADRAESESTAVDKLIAIARTESDTDLRKTAVLGLPANDPRARELLLAILRGM